MPLRQTLAASAALTLLGGAAQAFTLQVAHFNDFHSRIESINAFDSTCSAEDETAGECFGGAARLVTAVKAARDEAAAAGEPILVLEAGDAFQGSLFFTAYSGQAEAEMLNRIGIDAMVYGNHEFDLGPEPLAKFIETADFPVISGSADVSADNLLAPLALDRLVLDVGGEKVAILGATTPDTAEISTPGPTVSFRAPVDYLRGEVATLEAEGVDKIILLSHLGTFGDEAVAAAVPGIDLIVGGHSHTLYSNTAEDAPFRYPLMVEGIDGHAVPIVQAGAYSKYLGLVTLTFDDKGVVTEATGDTKLLDASVTPDPDTLAAIDKLAGPIEELKARVVAEIPAGLDGSRETCRAEECALGSIIADAMVDRVKDQGVTIGLQNGGGVRASIGAGTVTMGDVLAVLPFQNTLSTFNLPGSAIVAALENGVSQVEEGAGRFPQVSGLRFSWDPKAPAMSRIKSVEVHEGDGWVPLDPAKVYSVASNNFMRAGGDGYASLRDEATNAYDYGPGLEDVLANFLAAHPDYSTGAEPRITRVE
ncbi:MAG TPA: 5'-nucleotidase C-terminal domain-containing protein [Amaricoccus sp.]|nr:5'-nucleotidase C-terminal domain-containing protein [Amaricoccus sp.]